ncbi:MAG TPA: cytochrome c oxidase assembly protein [Longimicrobiales bacterium]|nr:cytochrome c oxidase assembly protein [Longimicrobiales bacterium]
MSQSLHPMLALLHGDEAHFSWTEWDAHPSIILGCGGLLVLYLWAIGPGRERWGPAGGASRWQAAAFVTGIAILFVALTGPLHDLSDYFLFSAHMVQHMLLMMLVPPLLLLGTPAWMLRPLLRQPGVGPVARFLTNPLIAFGVYNVVFVIWHFPFMYNAALENHDLHIVQHLMFIAAATMMWWPVVNPVPELARMAGPVQILYLFGFGIPASVVSAFIALSENVVYPFYGRAPRVSGLSALEDQQLGGMIMWVPGMIILWVAITIVFFRWARREDREEAAERERLTGHASA